MRPKAAIIGLLAMMFLLLLLPEIGVPLLILMITLVIGWYFSLVRVFEGWHSSETSVFLFGLALLVLVARSHFCLRWLYASLQTRQRDLLVKWRWKWTLCGYAMLSCGLMAIGSLMLTTHQLYWLSKSSDPMFADPVRERLHALHDISGFQKSAEDVQWNEGKTRASFLGSDDINSNKLLYDVFEPVWVEKDTQTLAAVILIPRHPLNRSAVRVAIVQPGTNTTRPLSELHQVLASFGIDNTNAGPGTVTSGR